jgi:hypothetical protein
LDLEEYYNFCDQENLSIFWCELNHPEDLDMRRQPMALRQLAIDEIDRVVAKYKHCQHLAVDALERYRLTLQDNSYLLNIHHTTNVQVFHQNIEAQLKKSVSFADLWPTIVNTLS